MKLVFSRGIVLVLVFFVWFPSLKAQEWEYGVTLGTSGYMGEYNQDKLYQFNSFTGSIGVKYNFNSTWGVRGDLAMIGIKGDGKHLKDPVLVDDVFINILKELSISSEFNFFKFEPNTKKAAYTPYVFAGLGAVMFDPKGAHEKAKKQILRPIVLYGAGFKYNLKSAWSIKGELAYRTAFTDWLDSNASQYEYESNKYGLERFDSYMSLQLGLTYTIFKQGCPTW